MAGPVRKGGTVAAVLAVLAAGVAWADPGTPAEDPGPPAILDDGRVKPLDTFARELFRSLTGRERFRSPPAGAYEGPPMEPLPADRGMALWRLAALGERAAELPILQVQNLDLKGRLGIPERVRYVSARAALAAPGYERLRTRAREERQAGRALEGTLAAWGRLDSAIGLLAGVVSGEAFTIVPLSGDPDTAEWEGLRQGTDPFLRAAAACMEAAAGGDETGYREAARSLARAQAERSGGAWPARRLAREVRYNALAPYARASWGYLVAFVLYLAAVWSGRGAVRAAAWVALLGSLSLHIWGFGLRWMFQGHVPLSNLYEALAMMAAGVALWALLLEAVFRTGWIGVAAAPLASGILALCHAVPVLSPHPSVLVPALQSWWMQYHVSCMVIGGYGGGGVAAAVAHAYLFHYLFRPAGGEFRRALERHLYWGMTIAVTFIGIGLCLGAAWANESWGRYWGWDPKETWGLVTLLGYVAVLHGRIQGTVRGAGLACGALLGFSLVLMTVYGVNLIGKGLHSYGFFEGGWWPLVGFWGIEVILVAACAAVALRRNPRSGDLLPGTSTRAAASPPVVVTRDRA